MKTKIQILKWMLSLVLLMAASGAWAQTPNTDPTQTVCIGVQDYYVVPGSTGNNFTWAITPGVGGIDWTITPNGNNYTVKVNWINVAPLPATFYTLTLTETVPGPNGCSTTQTVQVTVNPLPVAPTVSTPVEYCQNATASALTATGTSLLWYTAATGGTGSSIAPTPSTATVGNTSYWVSQTNGSSCEGPRAEIVVTINSLPAAPTVSTPVEYCQNATASALTATGTSLLWYTAATGGTGSSTAPTPSTATVGSTSYWVSQTNGSSCEGPRAEIVVTINSLPAAPIVSTPVNYCQNATASALTATGTGLLWYTAATGGTGSSTAPTPSTATVGSTSYWVSQTNGSSCEGPRAEIVVIINARPNTSAIWHN